MKKLTKIRIRNSLFIALLIAAIGLGLYAGLNSDGKNRFWEGKALGGSIAMVGILVYLITISAIKSYTKNKSLREVSSSFKKGFTQIISTDWRSLRRKSKKNSGANHHR